jgi:hypothetical protein
MWISDGFVTDDQALWRRLTDVWPRALYRWNEQRYTSARSEVVFRSIVFVALLGVVIATGALAALVILLQGAARSMDSGSA